MEKLKYISLFSGIGSFEKALDRLQIPYDLINFCEFDKYAIKSYCAIHNVDENKNLGDITKVDEKSLPKDIDLITYGFPCQDISLAGKQKGLFNEDGTTTRSGLFFEALRIIEETKPRVAIAENVKNLTSKKFSEQFKIVLDSLEQAGYNNKFKVLNSRDFGIPQNRERVFIVSIRKDIDNGEFKFPEGFPLELRLKDMLESDVDEKFYINKNMIKVHNNSKHNDSKMIQVGQLDIKGQDIVKRVYSSEGLSPTLTNMQGGNRQPKVIVHEATKKGYAEACEGDSINLEQPNSKTRRGRVGKQVAQTLTTSPQQVVVEQTHKIPEKMTTRFSEVASTIRATIYKQGTRNLIENIISGKGYEGVIEISNREQSNAATTVQKYSLIAEPTHMNDNYFLIGGMQKHQAVKKDGICTTLTSSMGSGGGYVPIHNYTNDLRIRKFTPKECWHLMGFDDEDFEKAEKVCSNSQLYKQAGNSVVVNVPYYIYKALAEYNILIEKNEVAKWD